MNKKCSYCKKRITKKQDHLFAKGKRWHSGCWEEWAMKKMIEMDDDFETVEGKLN